MATFGWLVCVVLLLLASGCWAVLAWFNIGGAPNPLSKRVSVVVMALAIGWFWWAVFAYLSPEVRWKNAESGQPRGMV